MYLLLLCTKTTIVRERKRMGRRKIKNEMASTNSYSFNTFETLRVSWSLRYLSEPIYLKFSFISKKNHKHPVWKEWCEMHKRQKIVLFCHGVHCALCNAGNTWYASFTPYGFVPSFTSFFIRFITQCILIYLCNAYTWCCK